jgi:O-acetylserine/cysteine efflux transporter
MSTPHRPLGAADWMGAAGVVVIWGLNFVVMKVALQDFSPMLLGAVRFVFASFPFLPFLARPNLPWRFIAGYGLAQGLGQFGFLFLGLKLGMPAGMASVVMQTQAFFTLLMAGPLLGERATPWQWAGLVVALGGLLVIGSAHGAGPADMTLVGFLLTLGAALMWATSNLVARRAAARGAYDALPFIAWSSLFPILPFLALTTWFEGSRPVVSQLAAAHWPAWAAVAYLALLATLLAYTLWTRLLQRHAAARVTPFSLLVPIVGLLAAGLFLGEWPNKLQWIGTAGVLAGLVVNQFGARVVRWVRGVGSKRG